MISHAQAQALISDRLDGPLDPVAHRELLAHLATCAPCQRFAESSNHLARGLRDLPQLPSSPVVSRAVLERVEAGRSPWRRLLDAPPRASVAFAGGALVLLLGLAFTLILNLSQDDDPPGRLAVPLSTASAVAQLLTPAPTDQATEAVPPTDAPESIPNATATNPINVTVGPTDTPTPTEAPAPTERPAEPTDTPVAATDTPVPATEVPATEPPETEPSAPTEAPTDAPQSIETQAPAPTDAAPPTETPVPATETPIVSAPTETPTAAVIEESPLIVPRSGTVVADDEVVFAADAAEEPTPAPTDAPTEAPTEAPVSEPAPTDVPEPTPTPAEVVTFEDAATETPAPSEDSAPEEEAAPAIVTGGPSQRPRRDRGPDETPTPIAEVEATDVEG